MAEKKLISLAHIQTKPPPSEKKTRIAWPNGPMVTNKEEALKKFLERKSIHPKSQLTKHHKATSTPTAVKKVEANKKTGR